MNDFNDEKKFGELGLQKVTAYIRSKPDDERSFDASPNPSSGSGALTGKTDAQRKKLARKRQKELGLSQMNIIVQDSNDIRERMTTFSRRLVDLNNWDKAILADPAVRPILAALEHAKIRLCRIDDLEERHRRLYPLLQLHSDLINARGFRWFLLRLSGVDFSNAMKKADSGT